MTAVPRFSPEQAIACAGEVLAARYAGAEFAIAAGSIVRGEGTDTSDLDLVVIFRNLENAWRESFLHGDMPVEAFVNDYETIQGFMDRDHRDARATMLHMLATGVAVPGDIAASKLLQHYAQTLWEAGPPPVEPAHIDHLRYVATDLLDDLRGHPPPHELRSILYKLYQVMAELRLRQAKRFVGGGKHLARGLSECDAAFAEALDRVMRAAHTGGFGPAEIAVLSDLLAARGGRLFEGYRQPAPADVRTPAKWYGVKP